MAKDSTKEQTVNYEKLTGPNRFYRATRIPFKEFGDLDVLLEVSGPDGPVAGGNPQNLSATGLMAAFPRGDALHKDDQVTMQLRLGTYLVYKGKAVVRRVEPNGNGIHVGIEFLDGLVNPDDVRKAGKLLSRVSEVVKDVSGWKPEYEETDDTLQYLALLTEFRAFMVAAKRILNKFEEEMGGHLDLQTPGFKEMFDILVRNLTPIYEDYLERFDPVRRRLGPDEDEAMKRMAHLAIHDLILEAPYFWRSLYKPRGYPGDYKLMGHLYENHWEGDSLFAKYEHYSSCVAPATTAVRTRKELVKGILRKKLQALGPDDRFRYLSIAAGPAQETYELLLELDESSPVVDIALYEQDEEALEFSYKRIMSRVKKLGLDAKVNLMYLHDSVRNLIGKPVNENVLSRVGKFDVIFASGLFDYLKEKYAKSLIAKFYQFLNPGGTMAIGNMDGWNPNRWVMEHLLEWPLIYRTKDELYHLGDDLPGNPDRSIAMEETRINNYLIINKPLHDK